MNIGTSCAVHKGMWLKPSPLHSPGWAPLLVSPAVRGNGALFKMHRGTCNCILSHDMNLRTGGQQALLTHVTDFVVSLPSPGAGSPKKSNWLPTKPAHAVGPDARLFHLPGLHHCRCHGSLRDLLAQVTWEWESLMLSCLPPSQQYNLASAIETADAYTVFAPNNNAIENYIREKKVATLVGIGNHNQDNYFLNFHTQGFSIRQSHTTSFFHQNFRVHVQILHVNLH